MSIKGRFYTAEEVREDLEELLSDMGDEMRHHDLAWNLEMVDAMARDQGHPYRHQRYARIAAARERRRLATGVRQLNEALSEAGVTL